MGIWLENVRHCGAGLTEYTRKTWSSYMRLTVIRTPGHRKSYKIYTHVYRNCESGLVILCKHAAHMPNPHMHCSVTYTMQKQLHRHVCSCIYTTKYIDLWTASMGYLPSMDPGRQSEYISFSKHIQPINQLPWGHWKVQMHSLMIDLLDICLDYVAVNGSGRSDWQPTKSSELGRLWGPASRSTCWPECSEQCREICTLPCNSHVTKH